MRTCAFFDPMANYPNFGDMFAHAAIGFAVTDPDGVLIDSNEKLAKIVDRSPAELLSANLFELTHPDDRLRHCSLLDQLLSREIPGFVIEKRYLRRDGTPVWVRNSVSLVSDEPRRLLSLSEDISTSKRAQQVLERQEQLVALGRLTSSIIHEINNPLSAVLNLLYLARNAENLEVVRSYLEEAEEELSRAAEITMQGLQFHRQPTVATSTSVVEIMRAVLTLFKARLRVGQVELKFIPEDAPRLMCLPGEVRQVFINLIGNALDSMPKGGGLTIRVRPATQWATGDQGVRVTIADTGTGMSSETVKRMYDAFFTTKGSGGSGLGLWVTANIVRKHRGTIRARSKTEAGTGTVFTVTFPHSGAQGMTAGVQDAA